MEKINHIVKPMLFISRLDERTEYDTAQSMAKAMQSLPETGEVKACFLEDIVFVYSGTKLSVYDTRNKFDIADYSSIFFAGWFIKKIYEDIVLSMAVYASVHNVRFLNHEALINRSKGKLSQYVIGALHNINVPAFVFSLNSSIAEHYVVEANMSYPFIMKGPLASRGKHNYLVQDKVMWQKIVSDRKQKELIIQRFIPNEGDYRLIVMGEKVRLAIQRHSLPGSHLNNTSQGGSAKLVDLHDMPPAMLNKAVLIAKLLNREVTGVDMIVHTHSQEFYFLEANNMPQLSTGVLVEQKMAALARYFVESGFVKT